MTDATSLTRARDLGIPFSGNPGPKNSITDIPGIEVGFSTLWSGTGALKVGEGPIRTGVTAILPRGRNDRRPYFASSSALNAAGEVTGLGYLEERGMFDGPILITNTHSVGTVRDAVIRWMRLNRWSFDWTTPIVGETYDGLFNDIDGGHVKEQHVFEALDTAHNGVVAEGNVGGGAGMISYWYKGGTGTASRQLSEDNGGYIVGALVQSNYGTREQLRIGGIPMGEYLAQDLPRYLDTSILPENFKLRYKDWCQPTDGSIIVVIATNAPLLPHQLKRISKRPGLGIGRLGGVGATTSGDIFIALSTANENLSEENSARSKPSLIYQHPNLGLTPLFQAVIDATEEAIMNALVASDTAEGANGLHVPRLPHDKVREALRAHNLLTK